MDKTNFGGHPQAALPRIQGQTRTIFKYRLDHLLPSEVELVHGPGCPVCVTSLEMIDKAQAIARRPDVISRGVFAQEF